MAMNLHDSLMNLMTPELMSAMAAGTGESEGAVSKGLTAGVPLVLAGPVSYTHLTLPTILLV